jgi:predicted lipoprotein with Yx(FWY)xxD motif
VAATTAAALAIAALVLLGPAVAGANAPPPAATATGLKTTTIGGTTILTSASGFDLYWFAPGTPTRSTCYGSCAAYWPPVTGAATASPGQIATITATSGARQLTYNGHPLCTYAGDSASGQTRGNNLNLNGGLWHEVVISP